MFLNIAAANVRTAKVESKNLFESATPIEIGKNYAGEICKEDQGISYVIQRKAGMELIVKGTCIHVSGEAGFIMYLYNEDREKLIERYIPEGSTKTVSWLSSSDGLYYIIIKTD